MLIIPAIDIRGGNCVRLLQGDPGRETVYSNDPLDMALRFQDAGARLIHIVDLDGAFEGRPVNAAIVIKIAKALSVPVEIGGGIRTLESVCSYADAGIPRIILGTAILHDAFQGIIDQFEGILVAGVDAKDGMVATHGWRKVSGARAIEIIREIHRRGIPRVIYTDIATDGMLSGPNVSAIDEILSEIPGIELVASGGISSIEDIERLHRISLPGLLGCITGKAVYDGKIDLREAISRFSKDEKDEK